MSKRFLLYLVLLFSFHAFAQTPEENLNKAKVFFEEAEKYYRAGSYEKALERYTEAYVLADNPALLFNIGQCQRNLKRFEETLKTYKKYIQDASTSNDSLVENLDGIKFVLTLVTTLSDEADFPKDKLKKSQKEVSDLASAAIKKADALPKASLLKITGADGAEIFVDGESRGALPIQSLAVKPGKHTFVLKKSGYADLSLEGEAKGDGAPIALKANQIALKLIIETPAGALIYLNEKQQSATTEALPSGKYRVKVTLDGHQDWTTDVNFPTGSDLVTTVTASPKPIKITINTPKGGQVFFDGEDKGQIPVTIEKPSHGKHVIVVKKEGLKDSSDTITISGASDEIKLSPKPGLDVKQVTKKNAASIALFGVAGVSAAGSVATLAAALINKQQLNTLTELGDPGVADLLASGARKVNTLEIASGVLFAAAAGSVAGGVVLAATKDKSKAAQLLLTPNGIALTGGF